MAVPCARSGLQGGLPGGPKSPLPHFCIGGRRNPFAPSGGASWGGALCAAMGCPPPQGGETGAGGELGVLLGLWLPQWACREGLAVGAVSSLSPPSLSAHRKRVGPSKQVLPGPIRADKGCGALNASPAESAGP